jgi:hypothetical protein
MKEVTLHSAQEFYNFKNACLAHNEKFDYNYKKGLFFVTASITFLTAMGF